ncbi:MAG: YfhO family protein [Flavobacteriales bacterium]|nr:YfhO family protein [Flavobacteriales bacterium]
MDNLLVKNSLKHIGSIFLMFVLCVIYFYPETQGKKIPSHDGVSAVANSREYRDFQEKGETILWSSRVFSGMPLFQIAYNVKSNLVRKVELYRKTMGINMSMMFALMLGLYICLSLFGLRYELSLIGAIGFGLSTWFMLSVEASHSTKLFTISYIPPLIASIYYAYRKQLLLGGILTSLFLCLAIAANHIQIVYYSMFFIFIIAVFEFAHCFQTKEISGFFKKSAILVAFGILGILPNTTLLWTTYDYAEETTRSGNSELNKGGEEAKSKGAGFDYSMRWSYGKEESFNFLIPGFGGGGLTLDEGTATYEEFRQKGMNKNQALNSLKGVYNYYAGPDGNTGPTYLGAVLLFLFLLLFFIEKSKIKWMLLSVIILTVMFSWGKNFLILNEFFFNHFPMFNKFRTPSMWLSMTIICVSIGAMFTLKNLFEGTYDKDKLKKGLFAVGGFLGVILLYFLLMGSGMDFTSLADANLEKAGFPIDTIIQDRIDAVQSDVIRSFILIALAFGTIWLMAFKNLKNTSLAFLIFGVLILVDMWSVGKRFMNEDDFAKHKNYDNMVPTTTADNQVKVDTDASYRVFNVTGQSGPFNDAITSYHHQSIGGYSSVKLYRYQDLIENQLSKNNMNVINMLNTKYFITGQQGQASTEMVQQNPGALGNCWFINEIQWAKNADEEMAALTDFNPSTTVIIDERFKNQVGSLNITPNPQNKIELTSFHPDKMGYTSNSTGEQFAVFSEVWYKGNKDWKVTIDGKEAEMIRVNYLLRGLKIPAGNHKVEFTFHPTAHYTGNIITTASSILLILLLLGLLGLHFKNSKNKELVQED